MQIPAALFSNPAFSCELPSAGVVLKQTFVAGSDISVIVLNTDDHPKAIEMHEDGAYRIEGEFYSYTQGSGATASEITILNSQVIPGGTKINLLKFY